MNTGDVANLAHSGDELVGLIATLHETERRIRELTGGTVDAVLHPSGSSYILGKELSQSAAVERRFAIQRAAILDALPANLALLNSDGEIVAVNSAWRRYARANAFQGPKAGVGQNYIEVCERAGESSEEARAAAVGIRSVLSGRLKEFAVDYPCPSPNEQRWFRMQVTPVEDADPGGCVVMHADITESKNAEKSLRASLEELRESEARFRQLAENITDVFWIGSLSGEEIIYVSPAFELIWGHSCRELYDNPGLWLERIHENDRPEVLEAMKKYSLGQYRAEFRIVRPDGSERWISARSFPVRDEAGDIYRIVGIASDVTAKKYALDKLEQQAALLDEAHDAILVVGTDGLVQFWNRGAERIYGWTASEVMGRPIRDLLYNVSEGTEEARLAAAKARGELEKALAIVIQSGRWSGRLRHCKKDGSAITAGCTFSVLRDRQGNPRAFLGVNADITHRIAFEEQYGQLQRLESIGQLTGGIAHDFNNLLTIILGNAELLVESLSPNPELLPLAEVTMAAAQRGADLVSRLLTFARQQPLEPKAVDVNTLVLSMEDMLHRTLGGHVEIKVTCAGALWDALVDAPQLENALLNLCINARDAMPNGGILTIATANAEVGQGDADQNAQMAPGQYVIITVSDTGIGMPPEVLARAFDPFFTTKDVGKGSGLGLSMVFGFANQSKGHVKIYSKVGYGTRVEIYLPRAIAARETSKSHLADNSIPSGSEKILYVEDDEWVSKNVTPQLISLGYQVVHAENGVKAIKTLENTKDFDLLFTDIMMPGGINGWQLSERARELRPSLAVLYTSGFSDWATVDPGRLDSGAQLLAKPFRRGDLARKIRQVLDSPVAGSRTLTTPN